MRVSVIIPNYNYAEFVSLAIDSVLAQTEKVDEIIVVDDGSTDLSREIIEAYGDRIIPIFQSNAGQAGAMSAGFSRATGDIVCFLDSDDVFFPDKVMALKQLYQSRPEIGWVFHALKHLTPEEARDSNAPPVTVNNVHPDYIDARYSIRNGKPGYDAPATSGLSFRRDFIADIFPLPLAKSIYISDHYIKFYALAKGPGFSVKQALGGQIIHGENLYTGQKAMATRGRIFVNTGYYLFEKMPELKKFCVNLVTEGLL